MAATALSYGIPDIDLPRLGGGAVNPAAFVGHELVVFFCPPDPDAAAAEVEAYRSRAADFADGGAWVIGVVGDGPAEPQDQPGARIALARDRDGAAAAAFEALLDPDERGGESRGGTFFFTRGGALAAAWRGFGHAEDALEALSSHP